MDEIQKITSRENARLQHFRKVRDGKVADQIFIEGARLAEETLRTDVSIIDALVSTDFIGRPRSAPIIAELIRREIKLIETGPKLFGGIADTVNSQGIILLANRPRTGPISFDGLSAGQAMFLYLHEISDPSNLGAVFRTAEAADVTGIVISARSADPFSPKCLRAGLGSNLRLQIWENAVLQDAADLMKNFNGTTVAADIKGKLSYTEYSWKGPRMLVMGSEAHGLSDEYLDIAEEIVRIPMKAQIESLNLAVAAGVILFEAARQRSTDG